MDKKQRQQLDQINQQAFVLAGIQMQTVFNKQKTALNETNAVVGSLYLQYAVAGLLVLKATEKTEISNQFDEKLKTMYMDLGTSEVNEVTDILKNDYQSIYKDLSDYVNSRRLVLTEKQIDDAIDTAIDGKLYSDRIWSNKDKLVNLLRKSIKDILQGDMAIDETVKQIQNVFNVTAYDSKRLLDSELTRVQGQASTNLCNDLGIETQIWSATFENTCKECMALDGQVFDVGKAPSLPRHSNCGCLLLPNI